MTQVEEDWIAVTIREDILPLLHRRQTKPRAPARRKTPGPYMRKAIRAFFAKNPGMSNQDIATRFGVNPGRVSEAIGGA